MVSSSDLILQALSPRIVIFADEQVNRSCQLNGCKTLEELFKPWQSEVQRVPVLSSTLSPKTHPSFTVRFTSHSTLLQSQFGGGGTLPYSSEIVGDIVSNLIHSAKSHKDNGIPYEILRDVLLASCPVDGQGTFNHPVCQLFAISTSNAAPLETLIQLIDIARKSPVFSMKPYMGSSFKNSQRFYLLVHDVSMDGHDLTLARQILRQVEERYGPHCGLLVINSSSPHASQQMDATGLAFEPDIPPYQDQYATALNLLSAVDPFTRLTDMLAEDILVELSETGLVVKKSENETRLCRYARYLGKEDIDNIRECIRGMTVQSIIPWMETRVREWNEIFIQSRKGIAGRLFGAGRKLFGTAGNGSPDSTKSTANPYSAAQYTIRRSADFAFMLRDYKSATFLYEAIRQDYIDDGTFLLMSNVVVMHGLSCLLSSTLEAPRISQRPFEAITLVEQALKGRYQPPRGQLETLRDLLSFVEVLSSDFSINKPRRSAELSKLLVTAAQQVEELFSAILLEKAALFDTSASRARTRKRALHLTLSAWQYEHCGLKLYYRDRLLEASQCLQQCVPTWRYIEEFLQYGLGQQAYISGDAMTALKYFSLSMKRGMGAAFRGAVFEDILLAFQQYSLNSAEACDLCSELLPGPVFDKRKIIIKLSEGKASGRQGNDLVPPSAFGRVGASSIDCNYASEGAMCFERTVLCDIPFRVMVAAVNPSNVILQITNLKLLLLDDHGNSVENAFSIREISSLILTPLERRLIYFDVVPKEPMQTESAALVYCLAGKLFCMQRLSPDEQRSSRTKLGTINGIDEDWKSVKLKVIRPTLPLQCRLFDIPHAGFSGENVPWSICLENVGGGNIQDISLGVKTRIGNSSFMHENSWQPATEMLPPTEKLIIKGLVHIRGEGETSVEMTLEYKLEGERHRNQITYTRVIYVWPSFSSFVFPVCDFTEQHLPISLLSVELESSNRDQNLYLVDSTLVSRASQLPGTSRAIGTILRMHQLYRNHPSLCFLPRSREEIGTSKICECASPSANMISLFESYPHRKVNQIPMSGERQGQHSPYFNAITAPPQLSDGNPRQCDITADITLKASSSEEFYGLTRRVTSRPKGMNRNINTKPTDALGCSLSPWLETNKGDPNAAQEYASFTVQNNLTSTIIQLLNVLTLSVEDRCMVISTSPEYNSNDKISRLHARFVLWNRSEAKMKWKLRPAESIVTNSSIDSPATCYIGRSQFTGILSPHSCVMPVSSAISHQSGFASLGEWVLEWVHGDTDTWQSNPNFQQRFRVIGHPCERIIV